MYKVSETVLPIYINGQCPIIKTCSDVTLNLSSKDSRGVISIIVYVYKVSLCVCRCSMLLVLFCIRVNHLCTLYLYSFFAVVYRGPHGRLAFFLLNVLPSENKCNFRRLKGVN